MEKLIFACLAPSGGSGLNFHVPLLAASIRRFAGILSDCPMWVLIPESEREIPRKTRKKLESLSCRVVPFVIDPDVVRFPFAGYVLAAAAAESLAEEHTEFLVWMGLDTLVIGEPTQFLLDEGKAVGYRPVHHTLIGSIYEEALDPFWELVYRTCHVSDDKIFPMRTHVDHNILRPYFNAGHMIVRPERGFLQMWEDYFRKLYCDPRFEKFYEKNELYSIFIHQAILTGVILSNTEKHELLELPFTYNYPLHLLDESPRDLQPQHVNDLITVRYEESHVLETTPFCDPLKSWLTDQLNSLASVRAPS